MSNYRSSCIRLINVTFYAHHGVHREEHFIGAKYEVDAELRCNFTRAAEEDDISQTIDYGIVYEKIRNVLTQKKYYLIEAVAYTIAEELLGDLSMLDSATIKVRKRNPPIGGVCDYAEAEYCAARKPVLP
ncbi:MAG: dihydroneopterin aldolase [Prosthecochloris sp.]|uniref:dihydroneopterin aldolase n=1 Tax=unclassified Prosthecochloris TaxID=2632826 RepID=UPI000DF72E6A|nr:MULTISPECIES: dihydroneopterin aldolase [unclassified Prosthecochloris]MCW8797595.1 dihydroneopterin aldolase [Prosthecochloris sp.]NEX12809.1 dihydroneopterin aldolase [Prosthecochloris sp.]RDD29505.1 dihydroneopterin aldolase [Prosthecochloris sp. ZM]